MEIMEREGKFFLFHAEEIPEEIAAMMQDNNILHSLLILKAEKPEFFGLFISYCQEYIGNEEIIPKNWNDLRADFADYIHAIMDSII